MKKLLLVAALIAFLGGCATTGGTGFTPPSVCTPEIVKVPVPTQPPAPPSVSRPVLAITTLSPADYTDPGQVVKAYKASVKQLQGYAEQLEIILNSYRSAATAATTQPSLPTIEGVDDASAPVAASAPLPASTPAGK